MTRLARRPTCSRCVRVQLEVLKACIMSCASWTLSVESLFCVNGVKSRLGSLRFQEGSVSPQYPRHSAHPSTREAIGDGEADQGMTAHR